MPNTYIDILLHSSIDADELAGLINEPGFWGVWQDGHTIHVYWDSQSWSSAVHASLLRALSALGVVRPEEHISVQTLPFQDWNALWASQVKPIRIGRRVYIRPSWEPAPQDSRDIDLVIDPKQAFGTGHHATTQLLIQWLEEIVQEGETVLDIGTGSGILAMVALRLGAEMALGIDNDARAIDCAQEYATLNGFQKELSFQVGTIDHLVTCPWDIVLANIDRSTILSLAPHIRHYTAHKGVLLFSGLLTEDQEEVSSQYRECGWIVRETREQDGWCAMRLSPPSASQAEPQADSLNNR